MIRSIATVLVPFLMTVAAFGQSVRTYVVGVDRQHSRTEVVARVLAVHGRTTALASRDFTDLEHVGALIIKLSDDEASALRTSEGVTFVEEPVRVYAFGTTQYASPVARVNSASGTQSIPWGVSILHAPDLWRVTRGERANVAIIDTGIDYTHPDLRDQYAGGFNAIKKTSDPFDDVGHGTHVAGIIAAADNTSGVVGVAPHARIWSIKALALDDKGKGSGTTADIVAGIDWVIGKKAEAGGNWIINMSLGTPICTKDLTTDCASMPPPGLKAACQAAADAGILVFAATGNDSTPDIVAPVGYPASFSSVLAVGAVDPRQVIAQFSDQGPEVALVAPGTYVRSTWIMGKGADSQILADTGVFDAVPMVGSAVGNVTGRLVACGLGKTAADFPAEVRGNIAFIQRGDIPFADKTRNAVTAGAAAVAIWNNDSGLFTGTLTAGDSSNLTFPWPLTVSLSREDGQRLADVSGPVTISYATGDYRYADGTSMATPHAAAAAALVWSVAPEVSAREIASVLATTAHDLGSAGRDSVYGFGLVDPLAAMKTIAPHFFDAQPPTGRTVLRRGHS